MIHPSENIANILNFQKEISQKEMDVAFLQEEIYFAETMMESLQFLAANTMQEEIDVEAKFLQYLYRALDQLDLGIFF